MTRIPCILVCLVISCRSFGPNGPVFESRETPRIQKLIIEGVDSDQILQETSPGRLYVSSKDSMQVSPMLILNTSGFEPGTSIHWLIEYQPGPLNPEKLKLESCFSVFGNFDFDPQERTSRTDSNGQAFVVFTSTTYAGDSFRFGVSTRKKHLTARYDSFPENPLRGAALLSKPYAVWKRIYIEPPKLLLNVEFPESTWTWIKSSLARMNIEVVGQFNSLDLDPSHPDIAHQFDQTVEDLRYGPRTDRDFVLALQQINNLISDNDPKTINIVVLGALSKDRDLITNKKESFDLPPQPVDYRYHYKKEDFDLRETDSYGTGYATSGSNPSVIVFSDFWFVASKILNVPHEKALARVILHELGHHLLMHKKGGEFLDLYGHPIVPIATQHMITTPFDHTRPMLSASLGIMNGTHFMKHEGSINSGISSDIRNVERQLIMRPVWKKEIERLIRKDYIPQK